MRARIFVGVCTRLEDVVLRGVSQRDRLCDSGMPTGLAIGDGVLELHGVLTELDEAEPVDEGGQRLPTPRV
jgi:hypothetical protein